MVQPYPSAGQTPEPVRPGPPPSVVMAVRLMYAGAVVSAISLIVGLATVGSLRNSLHKANPSLTAAQLHNLQTVVVVGSVVIGVISIGLWVWMALMNKAGKAWARIVATVLFGLDTHFPAAWRGPRGGGGGHPGVHPHLADRPRRGHLPVAEGRQRVLQPAGRPAARGVSKPAEPGPAGPRVTRAGAPVRDRRSRRPRRRSASRLPGPSRPRSSERRPPCPPRPASARTARLPRCRAAARPGPPR